MSIKLSMTNNCTVAVQTSALYCIYNFTPCVIAACYYINTPVSKETKTHGWCAQLRETTLVFHTLAMIINAWRHLLYAAVTQRSGDNSVLALRGMLVLVTSQLMGQTLCQTEGSPAGHCSRSCATVYMKLTLSVLEDFLIESRRPYDVMRALSHISD